MTCYRSARVVILAAIAVGVGVVVTAQSQDRSTVKAANGIAFSEFDGYEAWPLVATSQPDSANGCGTSKAGCMKAILGNPAMMRAYREGAPANGRAVPDGAAFAKIEWLQEREETPYGVTVPGAQTAISFMVKDSKRFPDTNGWGYATFEYIASTDSFAPASADPNFARGCHACHTRFAKAQDFVFTDYARR